MHGQVEMYLDESGDLGYSARSARHMVAVALLTSDPVALRRLVRKASRRFGPRENHHLGELKFSTASHGLRMYLLEGIGRTDAGIAWAAVGGSSLPRLGKIDKESLMTSLFQEVVEGLSATCSADKVSVVMDRRRIREKTRNEFDRRMSEAVMSHHVGFFPPEVRGMQPLGGVFWRSPYGDHIPPRIYLRSSHVRGRS